MSKTIKYLFVGSVLGLSLAVSGCVVRGGVGYQSPGYYQEPTLVAVQPGVWVIADYNEPVFYSDNYYWAYRGGYWYRSSVYTGGWVRVRAVPHRMRGIHNPHRYVHYRAPARARTRRAPMPGVRDHRAYGPGYNRQPPPRANTRVPARRGGSPAYRPPAPKHRPATRPAARNSRPKPKSTPSRNHKSKSKSKERNHR